jgi:deazaflavin-dependent oxidoreductase (nitroreductase family)
MRRRYLRPPWMQRHVANRLVLVFRPSLIAKLSVRGRKSGRWRTVPVVVLEHDGERYLVSYRGVSDWALNLAASRRARLKTKARMEEIAVEEVPVAERPPLLSAYTREYGRMPTVAAVLRDLPDPADHPVFRIVTTGRRPPAE